MTYLEAEEIFLTAKDGPSGKPLANNTRLHKRGDDYAVRLHLTDVVTIHRDGSYTLNSGGWQTITTKERINRFSPASVYSDRKTWLVGGSLFEDGMKVGSGGSALIHKDPSEGFALQRKLDKLVRDYINGFCELIESKELKDPDGGDCWFCCMFDKAMGKSASVDHLFSHFEEPYYVPSLLVNALKEQGHEHVGFIWTLIKDGESVWARRALQKYFIKRGKPMLEHMEKLGGIDPSFVPQ